VSKYLLYVALIINLLVARENPFKPVLSADTLGATTIKKKEKPEFTKREIQLPNSARVLKTVEIRYQNLDSSIESKIIKIDEKIDWHDTLVLKKAKDKEIIYNRSVKNPAKKIAQPVKKIKFKNIISFEITDKTIILKTKDKKLRNFMVSKPYKIVIDFKKELSFYTKVYNLNLKNFKKITIGKHRGYYRVAIELDGQYLYNLKKIADGFKITLK
jgi:hypothetical protein